MTYAVLHAHDTYGSIGDSVLKISDYVAKAKSLGIKDLAVTNHGSMSTFVNFYEECKKHEINPIIGCEIYFVENRLDHTPENKKCYHLILLAKNYEGLKNLIRIHNEANNSGFYYRPRADWELLEKYHEGLICLSACIASPIARYVLEDDMHNMYRVVLRLKNIFGADFYLEVQPGKFEEQIKYNDALVLISHSSRTKLVATNDIHYLNAEDFLMHDYHIKDARKLNIEDDMLYPDKCYYLMGQKELENAFTLTDYLTKDKVKEAISNTMEIAKKCNVVLPEINVMPCYSTKINEYKVLEDLCSRNLARFFLTVKYPIDKQEYLKRLGFELATIKELGFPGYFLIVKDFIDFCDINGIARGPGRGSAAGSLVSFLLNISIADPIKYGLMFERFLSVHRTAIADVDLDILPEGRDLVYRHIKERYGSDHACFVRTYGMRKARNAVKAACRILKIAPQIANSIAKTIPYINYDEEGNKHVDLSIAETMERIDEFKEAIKPYPEIYNLAVKLEGFPASAGVHPAGVVISPMDITELYPLVPCKNEYFMSSSLDLKDVEKLSGVKFDLLALSSLTAISKTIKKINVKFDYTNENFLNDPKVWKLIGSRDTCGLFQISSKVYQARMPLLKPKTIAELAACLALVRGPCISSGADKKYIDILNSKEKPNKLHENYWRATKNTYGIVIYQEQILKICINIGFDSETAYKILKAVSKKKIDQINAYKTRFYELAKSKNIEANITDQIWQEIVNSGLYAFNIAHATSYALLCYSSAYLMAYYPTEYLANLLSKVYSKMSASSLDVLNATIRSCKDKKIEILAPEINGEWDFKVENDKIRAGFCSIKGIGEACYNEIKKHAPYSSFEDFINKVSGRSVNKRHVLILIAAGAFRNISNKDKVTLADYYVKEIKKDSGYDGFIKINAESTINIYNDKSDKIKRAIFSSDYFNQ